MHHILHSMKNVIQVINFGYNFSNFLGIDSLCNQSFQNNIYSYVSLNGSLLFRSFFPVVKNYILGSVEFVERKKLYDKFSNSFVVRLLRFFWLHIFLFSSHLSAIRFFSICLYILFNFLLYIFVLFYVKYIAFLILIPKT